MMREAFAVEMVSECGKRKTKVNVNFSTTRVLGSAQADTAAAQAGWRNRRL